MTFQFQVCTTTMIRNWSLLVVLGNDEEKSINKVLKILRMGIHLVSSFSLARFFPKITASDKFVNIRAYCWTSESI